METRPEQRGPKLRNRNYAGQKVVIISVFQDHLPVRNRILDFSSFQTGIYHPAKFFHIDPVQFYSCKDNFWAPVEFTQRSLGFSGFSKKIFINFLCKF